MNLNELNNEQRRAVETSDGPLMVVAGPGTGKTKTLTARITYLLEVKKVKPEELLALTFTNKAAAEMRQRVTAQFKIKQLPKITTFHALCYELLSVKAVNRIEVISEHERLLMIKELRKTAALKSLTTRELSLAISKLKNQLPAAATISAMPQKGTLRSQSARYVPAGNAEPFWSTAGVAPSLVLEDKELINLLAAYNKTLHQRHLHDFDDLLQQTYEFLSTKQINQRFTHILVDEFQDTNRLQYELLQLLRSNDNICVIGDPRQSIYGFRGASSDVFERFEEDFPHCRSITLTTNYRSALPIVNLTNAIFPDATPLQSGNSRTGHVRQIEVLNEYRESIWIINQIEQSVGGSDFLRSHSLDYQVADSRTFRDFAIVYRSHHVSKTLRKALAESGLPFQIVGEGSPYEQPAMWTIIQLLCYLIEPTEARLEILQRLISLQNISNQQLTVLLEQIQPASNKALTEQAGFIAEKLGVKSALLTQFINSLVRFETEPIAFVAYVDSLSEHTFYDAQADAITLMSIHAAKGLEFAHVFLLAAEEGILPHAKLKQLADLNEEKRLFYVAASRARDNLDILHAKTRAGVAAQPSSFLVELPQVVLERMQDETMAGQVRRQEKRQAKRRQVTLFDI